MQTLPVFEGASPINLTADRLGVEARSAFASPNQLAKIMRVPASPKGSLESGSVR